MALVCLFIAFAGCKKDKVVINPTGETKKSSFSDFSRWRKSLTIPKQRFSLNASNGGTIRGDRGYEFSFRPGTLVDQNNNPITGFVNIELIEATNAYEMMATGAGTSAVDGILGSVGMFSLNITQDGRQVFVNQTQPIQAMVTANPDASMDGVSLFQGTPDTISISRGDGFDSEIEWSRRNDSTRFNADSIRNIWDSIQRSELRKRCIRFDLYFLSWCNLDKYWNNLSGAIVQVYVPDIEEHFDTKVIMYLEQENLKGLVSLYPDYNWPKNATQYSSSNYRLPIGWKIKLIVISRDKDYNLLYETRTITNAAGTVHTFKNLTPISDEDLEAYFKNL